MSTLFRILACVFAGLTLYNMSRQETEAGRFTILTALLLLILYKLYL